MDAEQIKRREARAGDAMAEDFDKRLAPHTARFAADLIDLLYPQAKDTGLDIAGGSGAAGLKLADRIGPEGSVTIIDLSPKMLQRAAANAGARSLTNVHVQVMDAEQLDFPEHMFDIITCSFGIMFFPDVARALAEAYRVLKPGGRIGFTVWSAPERFPFFAVPSAAMALRMAPQAARLLLRLPAIGRRMLQRALASRRGSAYSPSRFGKEGSLEMHLRRAGFRAIRRELRAFPLQFENFQDFWETFTCATPMRIAMGDLPPEVLAGAKEEARSKLADNKSGGVLMFNEAALVFAKKA